MRNQALRNSAIALTIEVFPNLRRCLFSIDLLRDSTILTPKNKVINEVNAILLQLIPREKTVLYLVNYYKDIDNVSNFSIEFLYTINLTLLLPHALYLKLSCLVMLLRNLNPSNSLYNRTRLIILLASRKLLRCLILRMRHYSKIVQLLRIPLNTLSVNAGVKFTRQQFPIKLAFTITINKAQGQSLTTIGLLLDLEVFSYSQLYITLSRVTRVDRIRIVLPPIEAARKGRIKNVVYIEILQIQRIIEVNFNIYRVFLLLFYLQDRYRVKSACSRYRKASKVQY